MSSHEGWVPANCQQIHGQWFFNIKWKDYGRGWIGTSIEGGTIRHDFDGNVWLHKEQLELL